MRSDLDEVFAPTEAESRVARESSRRLSRYSSGKLNVQVRGNGSRAESIELPAAAFRLLLRILSEMAQGNAVTLVPINAELTTQQAADVLNVSRPYLIGLLEAGKIRHHKVGKHRRIHFTDLMEFKRHSDENRENAMRELAADAQELKMGY